MKLEGNLRKRIKIGVLLCAAVSFLGYITTGEAADYELTGIHLREKLNNDNERYYSCIPLEALYDAQLCNRSDASGSAHIANTLIRSSDGKILFAYDRFQLAGDFDQIAVSAISEASNALAGATPTHFSEDGAIAAIWGDTRLEEIATHTHEYSELTGLIEQKYGLLVAPTGILETTKDSYQPVYRVIGGDGLVVIISKDGPTQATVQRFVVAAGTLAEKNFESQARQFLAQDRTRPADDLSNWPEVAFMIRRLALNTTPENANILVDRVFGAAAGKKYHSHVWAILPTSVINHLTAGAYRADDIFGEETEFPEIRKRIVAQLESDPADPFSEFLLYTLGRFGEAVKFNPGSPIRTVLSYALGHSSFRQILSTTFEKVARPGDPEMLQESIAYYSHKYGYRDELPYKEESVEERYARLALNDFFHGHALEDIPYSSDQYKTNTPSVTQYINYFNQFPERYNSEPMVNLMPIFVAMTDELLPPLEEVLKDRESPHYDDAAYILGWLAYHRGQIGEALDRFGNVIALLPRNDSGGPYDTQHLDYAYMAFHQLTRIFRTLSPQEVVDRVQNSDVLSRYSDAWVTALTTFYHSHQYELVLSAGRQALGHFDIVVEDLPVTTDPRRIEDAFTTLKLANDWYLKDIVYLYQSSREIVEMENILANIGGHSPPSATAYVKELIEKYALVRDADLELMWSQENSKPRHKDLRQSIFLASKALALLPRTADYSKFREWLHYKRITLLAQFDPIEVPAANAEFRDEFPRSSLLDDVIAEEIFAEAVIVGDMAKATERFESLQQLYPGSNALDNAYSWMAIGWTCVGQPVKAREIDEQIVRLFPLTRHARYAQKRMQSPQACAALLELYNWDYHAMLWRERNRIDTIQAPFNANVNANSPPLAERQEPIQEVESTPGLSSAPTPRLTRVQAMAKVFNLVEMHMLPDQQALPQLRSYYAGSVDYYGKTSTLEEVMQDKSLFFDRWPARYYRVQYGSMQADCGSGQVCWVKGNYDWSVLSTKRLKKAAGTASFEYAISAQPPYLVIRETSEVLERH
jgi:tetratricopeptide (TPR) repeat protein